MDHENATELKCVRIQGICRFSLYGGTLDLPEDVKIFHAKYRQKILRIETPESELILKLCQKCKRFLDPSEFYQAKSPCKSCHKFLVRRWQKNNIPLVTVYKKKANKKYRDHQKLVAGGYR